MTARPPRLKWHMLRRRRTDPPHLRANLEAGLATGAALEVDVAFTADNDFVCLHDLTLDRETTGSGLVAEHARREIESFHQRGNDGKPLTNSPLFLDEVVAARAHHPMRACQVQLDIKEPAARFDAAIFERLRALLGDAAPAFIIGTTDAALYTRLRSELPGIATGFDPLALHEKQMPATAPEFEALADATMRLCPGASIYYLNAGLVLAGLKKGVNLVKQVSATGAEVDAWTVDPTRPRVREDLRALVEAGAHQITTNDPEGLMSLLSEVA